MHLARPTQPRHALLDAQQTESLGLLGIEALAVVLNR